MVLKVSPPAGGGQAGPNVCGADLLHGFHPRRPASWKRCLRPPRPPGSPARPLNDLCPSLCLSVASSGPPRRGRHGGAGAAGPRPVPVPQPRVRSRTSLENMSAAGAKRRLNPGSDRVALCQLWRSIILRDQAAMQKYSSALGVKGEALEVSGEEPLLVYPSPPVCF